MARRPVRREHLTESEVEAIVLAAIQLRQAILKCNVHLKPFNETYSLLHDLTKRLDATLEKITGRSIDYRGRDLGLLPPTSLVCSTSGKDIEGQ